MLKKIEAVVRPERFNEVVDALTAAQVRGMTVTEVRGHGNQKGYTQVYRGAELQVKFLPKVKVEVVVGDDQVQKVVDAVVKAARTGNVGDGKIFVLPLENAIRVRTGERGETAL